MMDIYEALVFLQYPKITLINPKDVESQILGGENRICLLSWLLQQNSKFSFPLLNKLKGEALDEEIFKYYSQIGICRDKEQLFGKCSMRSQHNTLKLLLLFIKNMTTDIRPEAESNELSVNDTLQHYFEKEVNILPDNFSVCTKLSPAEASKYIEETRKSIKEVKTTIPDSNKLVESKPESLLEENLKYITDIKNDKFKISLEKFTDTFKNVNTVTKDQPSLPSSTFNMNEIVDGMNVNFSTIKQALNCKDVIANSCVPSGVRTLHAPLTETVDETLFWLQRVSNAQTEEDEL